MAAAPAAIVEADAPPKKRLGPEPQIVGIADVALALAELAWIDSRRSTVLAALEGQIALLKAEAEGKQTLKVGRSNVPFAQRTAELQAAIVAFVEANPDEICRDGKKTRKFTHGEVALRMTKLGIELAEGQTWDDVIAAVKEHGMPRFVRVKEDLNKQRIVEELGDEKLTDDDLEAIGLSAKRPQNEAHIKLARYTCETPAAL